MKVLEKQVGGSHYKKGIQPWQYVEANQLDFFEGNVVKYVTRSRQKNGLEDLLKAQHYIEYLIERERVKLSEVSSGEAEGEAKIKQHRLDISEKMFSRKSKHKRY